MAPEMIIAPKPDINRTNMQARRIFTVREEPLNSFQINIYRQFMQQIACFQSVSSCEPFRCNPFGILEKKQKEKVEVFNIGTGRGLSVLELINAFEKATGVKLNYQIVGRRAGDIVKVWADPKLANEELG